MEALNQFESTLSDVASRFASPMLNVEVKNKIIFPFGTAAGLDKNGEALMPLSKIFGFLEPGTVVVNPREGNPRPRVIADLKHGNVYNAQGFPSKGLEYFSRKLKQFKDRGGISPVYVSICGIPNDAGDLGSALSDVGHLVKSLSLMADGFVWNPFSPNTEALGALRTPANFRQTAELICSEGVDSQLRLAKLGPFEKGSESKWLDLVGAWLEGGGDGIVAVNTKMIDRADVPIPTWGYPSAGKSGSALKSYRQRAIALAKKHFPNAVVIASGGIDSAEEAWAAFESGADALEGYTPYTFHGFGLMLELIRGLEQKLQELRLRSLQEYISHRGP